MAATNWNSAGNSAWRAARAMWHATGFERFAQGFQYLAVEFGQFVEE